MQRIFTGILCCPACHGDLTWDITQTDSDRIIQGQATCSACDSTYPVRDEIALFLTPDLPREDLWEQVDSRLSQVLRENPDLEAQMRESDNPADQFFLSMVLEERGDFDAAKILFDKAFPAIYTDGYLAGMNRQMNYVLETIDSVPVVDLASGRGYLVERLLKHGIAPVIATDFSPRVLRRDRDYFKHHRLYDHLSLIACDARRLPFKNQSIPTMTSYVGLANIEKPGDVVAELKRVVSGKLLAISLFYAPDDASNAAIIKEHGLLMFEDELLAIFDRLNWQATVMARMEVTARPTPTSEILGVGIDGLPVNKTTITWGTIVT
ncbi:MAG: methyltransferase domain-containing protein [Chloroflexi bacterium]|nr:methyltransferase domain-containing protein [Chloroflexota bacterium]